jgi:hypothetical protein
MKDRFFAVSIATLLAIPLSAGCGSSNGGGGGACSWTGTWNASFGQTQATLTLTQSGDNLTGSYPSHDDGAVTCTVDGNTANCTWSQSSSAGPCAYGPLTWTMDPSCQSFSGESYYCSMADASALWSGSRE